MYSPGAAESSIGGDWYDAFQLGDGRIVLSIGDVAGRGLRAAVVMGRVREAIRAFALQELKPAAILGAVERVLRLSKGETMVTALVAFVDPRAHTLTFANAGHPPPLLATGEGTVEALRLDGLPLGIFDDVEARTRTVALPDEAFLVFYTDGLIELERDVISGIAALRVAVERCYVARTRSAAAVYEAMTHDHAPDHDVAILTIAMQRLTNEPLQLEFPAVPESARLVRAALERFADSAQLDADRRFAIEVAVGEAVTNAIEHAYGIADGRVGFARSSTMGSSTLRSPTTGTGVPRARKAGAAACRSCARSRNRSQSSRRLRARSCACLSTPASKTSPPIT